MVAERIDRPRDPEEETVIERLDKIFETGNLPEWAQELAGELLSAVEMTHARKPSTSSEAEIDVSALTAYIEGTAQEVFDRHPGLYSEFMEGIKKHLKQNFR